jgi:intracellular multiplication protein IcmL
MKIRELEAKYTPQDNSAYIRFYPWFFYGLMIAIILLLLIAMIVFFQVFNRPLPAYYAVQPNGQKMKLEPNLSPSLIAPTIIRFASKAATLAYTFDFVNYNQQIASARTYFTDRGWEEFNASISSLTSDIVERQLFVSGVVSGTPVIANEGPLPGADYAWRVQIPFLVTYQSSDTTSKRNNMVTVTIIKVPTSVNPQGIGIDRFIVR